MYIRWKSVQSRAARTFNYNMINFDDYTNENVTKHDPKWTYIPDQPVRILIAVSRRQMNY